MLGNCVRHNCLKFDERKFLPQQYSANTEQFFSEKKTFCGFIGDDVLAEVKRGKVRTERLLDARIARHARLLQSTKMLSSVEQTGSISVQTNRCQRATTKPVRSLRDDSVFLGQIRNFEVYLCRGCFATCAERKERQPGARGRSVGSRSTTRARSENTSRRESK